MERPVAVPVTVLIGDEQYSVGIIALDHERLTPPAKETISRMVVDWARGFAPHAHDIADYEEDDNNQ